ncbi:MAG: hypothetical protein R2762_16165 [Bryobacteraceae bacterium]
MRTIAATTWHAEALLHHASGRPLDSLPETVAGSGLAAAPGNRMCAFQEELEDALRAVHADLTGRPPAAAHRRLLAHIATR